MDDIEALARGAAVGAMALTAGVFLRAWHRTVLGWVGAMYAAGAIGYILWSHPAVSHWPPVARLFIGIAALSAPFFFWALARLIFEDEFFLRPVHWTVLVIVLMAGVAQAVVPGVRLSWLPESLRIGFRLISLTLVLHVFWLVWKDRPLDLVERRARFRLVFLVGAGILATLILLAALFYGPASSRPAPARLGEAVAAFLLGLGLAIALMRLDRDFLPPEPAGTRSSPLTENDDGTSNASEYGQDKDLLARLDAVMRDEEAWRQTGLTISGLAARLAIPEYRLRRLINQGLGFRNFTAFLNEYRLSAAALRLADRDQARIPVLTIALELGWGSIGPFNRAFRARFGMTPTDYRRQQASSAASSR